MSSKGRRAERTLLQLLWENGVAAVRTAGSGLSFHSPDIICGFKGKTAAIQLKTTSADTCWLTKEEVENLLRFSERFGAEPWVVLKFTKLARGEFFFLNPNDLEDTGKHFKATYNLARKKGLKSKEFISILKGIQSQL